MSQMNISAIIVSYKSARLTINCLTSIASERASSRAEIRAIVVDNASGDYEEIRSSILVHDWHSWVTLIEAPMNGGFAYGNNLGIKHAYATQNPSYLYLLNPDTEVRPGAIDALASFMELHPEVGIGGSSIENSDGSEWPIAFNFPSWISEFSGGLELGFVSRILRRWEVAQTMSATPQQMDWICGASMMIRKAVIDTIGGLDENYFLYYEETDFCWRAKKAGFSTWYVPASRIMHIMGQSTKVTERFSVRKRLPGYWFESRRRYFVMNLGFWHACFIDVVAVLANCGGFLKRKILRQSRASVPYLIHDLLQHSVIWPRNRKFLPVSSFHPGSRS